MWLLKGRKELKVKARGGNQPSKFSFPIKKSPVPVQAEVPGLHMNMSAAVSSVAARTPSRDGEPQHV